MPGFTEGQRLQGSDGRVYVVRGGVPVPEGGTPATPPAMIVPPNPLRVAEDQRQQARQAQSDAESAQRLRMAQAAEARAAATFAKANADTQTPGDTSLSGEAYLATLPPAIAGQVKALSEGRRAFPTGSALRSPQMQELVAAATQYDPTLDAANAATRVATRKKFTSGTTRDNITAINTALGHLGSLAKDAEELHNRGFTAWNALANTALQATGDPRVDKFNITRHAVVDELEKAFRGSGGTQTGIDEWSKSLNSSQSPDQLRAAISKGVELLDSRLQALGGAYSEGMGKSADPLTLLNPHAQAVFQHLGPGGDGILPGGGSSTPPTITPSGGGTPKPPGGLGPSVFDNGAPTSTVATGSTKNVFDGETAAGINALVRAGRPYAEVAAFVQSKGFPAPQPGEYAAALAWQKNHPNSPYNAANPTRTEDVTAVQRGRASQAGTLLGSIASAGTAGFDDEMAGGVAALGGGDYTQARDAFQAEKSIGAELNPGANIAGNVIGGVGAALGAEAGLARAIPGALAMGGRVLGRFAPMATDAAYGAAYGAGESNDDRLGGAVTGALTGAGAGAAARAGTRGLANIVSPPAGNFGPAYEQGVFPTIGQRFGRSGIAGRIVNTAEQAMQSVPGLGSMVARARQIPRDALQTGAFNDALGEIAQQLPAGTGPGPEAHAYASQAFGQAYDTARRGMQFAPDQPYLADLGQFMQHLNSGVLNEQQAQQVGRVIENSVGSRLRASGGVMPGDLYQQAGTELGAASSAWRRDGTTQPMADAIDNFQAIFDNAARRNSHPQAVAALDAADRGYARLVRIQNASARGGAVKDAGTFTPANLLASVKQEAGGVRSGPFLRGEALGQDFAEAGRGLIDTLPNSGTADRLYAGQIATGGVGMALGAPAAIMAHPGALALAAPYVPGINRAVTRAIAPRSATLPPQLATALETIALGIQNRAPTVGRLAVPGALAWEMGR